MQTDQFEKLKQQFISADVNEKIRIYTETEDLITDQYKELLKHFPLEKIDMLEAALA